MCCFVLINLLYISPVYLKENGFTTFFSLGLFPKIYLLNYIYNKYLNLHIAELLFILAVFVSTVYWLILYGRVHFYKESVRYAENTNISIVIVGKNEDKNIHKNLSFIAQTPDITEVVYVDDFSTDDSLSSLRQMQLSHSKLNFISSPQDTPGKKTALTKGIHSTRSDNVLLTDADCIPRNQDWAKIMNGKLNENRQLVLGYGPLKKETGFVNLFSRFETVITAIQYFAFALYKIPYMGVGRNLAFTKELFDTIGGYSSHKNIPSGDDDLLVQDAAKKTSIAICLNPGSFVFSESQKSWSNYIRQKKRHIAVSSSYSWLHKILLAIHPFCHIVSFIVALYFLFIGSYLLVGKVFLIRWLFLMILGYSSYKKLEGQDLVLFIPIFDLMLIPYYLYFSMAAFNTKNAQWT